MKVSQVMHKGVRTHESNSALSALTKTMGQQDVGAVPIVERERVIGLVTDRDIALRALSDGRNPNTLTAADIMSRDIICCQESDSLQSAIKLMESRKVRRLPVLNQENKLVGMLSVGDISHALSSDDTARVMKSVSAHHA